MEDAFEEVEGIRIAHQFIFGISRQLNRTLTRFV